MAKIQYVGKNMSAKLPGVELLTVGNKKMTIPMFSIPAEKTCKGSTALCRKYCYAKRSERLFPNVKTRRALNLKESKQAGFVDKIIQELSRMPFMPYCRIHESGDFYSQEYLDKWIEIAKRVPGKKFLAFTKRFDLDYSNKPENLVIYFSVWNDTKQQNIKQDFNKAYTVMAYKSYQGKNIVIEQAEQCQGHCDTCLLCFENKGNVFFNCH